MRKKLGLIPLLGMLMLWNGLYKLQGIGVADEVCGMFLLAASLA